jgi:excisionase family DNA binding protein
MPEHASADLNRQSTVIAYSPEQAAQVSSLSVRSIAAAIATGDLRSFKRGRRRIIFKADLETYLRSAETAK